MRSIHHRGISHFRSTASLLFSTLFIAAMLFVGGSTFAHIPHDLAQSPYNLSDSSEHRWVAFYGAECDPPAHGTIEQIIAARNPQIVGPGTGTGVVDVYSGQNRNPCIGAAMGVVLPALQNGDLRLYAQVESSQTGEDFWFYIYDLSGAKRYERYFGDNGFDGIAQYDLTGVSLPSGEYILGFTPGAQGATNVNDPLNTKGSVHFTSIELRDIPQPSCSITAPSSVTQNAVFNFSWSSNNATHIALNYTGNAIFNSAGDQIPQTADMESSVNSSADLKISASSGSTDITLCVDSSGTSGSYSDCQARNPHATCSKNIAVTPAAAPTCTMSVNGSPASASQSFTYTPGAAFNLTFNTNNSTHGIYSLSGNSAYGGSHVAGESPIPSYGDLGTWPATPLTTTGPFHIDAGSGSTVLGITVDYSGTRPSSCSVTFNAPSGPSFRVQPTSANVSLGNTQQYQAYYDADGSGPQSEQLVTTSASWSSQNSSIAAVDNASQKGLATAAAGGSTQITASYTALSDSGGITVNVPQPTFVIAPPSATISVGASQQFLGLYDPDGPSGPNPEQNKTYDANWTSSSGSIATVGPNTGLAAGVNAGNTTIQATYAGLTATANLSVTSAPTTGTIQGFKVKMPGNNPNPIPPAGETVSLDNGSLTTANPYFFTNVSSGNHNVSVTVPSGWSVGYTLCYNSTGCHGNAPTPGSSVTVNVPAGGYVDLWWHYTAPSLTHLKCVSNACTRVSGSGSNACSPEGSSCGLQPTFVIAPSSASIQVGATQQFRGLYDPDGPSGSSPEQDKTYDANWTSNSGSIATVGPNTGLATGVNAGNTTIQAAYAGLTASANLTVTSAPTPTFVIAPSSASIQVGATQQFRGLYDPDGPSGSQAEQDKTNEANWSSDSGSVATVTNSGSRGLATGVAAGSTTIRAAYSGITATANLSVTSAPTHLECISNACTRVSGSGSDGCSPEGGSCGGDGNGGGGGCCGAGGSGPTGATATAPDCGQALVQWSDNSNDEDGFKIERASDQNGPWTEVGSVGANITQFLDQGISPSAKYFWRTYAFKGNAVSAYSNTVSLDITACLLAPLAPSDLQGQAAGCNAIMLNWKDNADNEAGFWVERKSPSDSDFSVLAAPAAASPGTGSIAAYTDSAANNGVLYDYRVSAFNASGFSPAAALTGILNPYPAVDFSYSPVPLLHGKIANFANLGQTFGGTTIAGSLWTFQNGKPSVSIKTNAQTVFQTPGTKTVALKVTDSQGRACTAAKNIAVSQNPDATFEEIPPE